MNPNGRPRRDGSKTERCVFRMSKEDMLKLEEASRKLGKTKSDVLREGLDLAYLKAKYSD